MADRAGLTSGLIMDPGFAMSALGMPIPTAIGSATFVLAWFLPSEHRIRELRGDI
jgi:hypothetical protein